jgi:hypothetical protein
MASKTIFLNMKGPYGVETIDEFTREENQSPKEFRKYVSEMVVNYQQSGMVVYKSSRSTKDWRER